MKKILSIVLLIAMLLTSFTFTAMASEEVVITTADALCKREGGGWAESTNEAVKGPTGGTSWYTKKNGDSVAFDASKLNGEYGVYLYMTPYASESEVIDVIITASGKDTAIAVNGRGVQKGNHWMFVGKHTFNSSANDKVVMQNTEDGGALRASAVKFVKDDKNDAKVETVTGGAEQNAPTVDTSADEVIITTADSLFSKTGTGWEESFNAVVAGPTGGSSLLVRNKSASASFDASAFNGSYGVYVYLTPYGATVDKVIITVTASGKNTAYVINGEHGGQSNRHWFFAGKHNFNASSGDKVTMQIHANSKEGSMRVSGVKFVKNDTNTAAVETVDADAVVVPEEVEKPKEIYYTTIPEIGSVIMGSEHPGYSMEGQWKDSSLAMPVEDLGYYSHTPGSSATWMPYLNKAEDVEIFYYKPRNIATEDPAVKMEVFAEGKTSEFIVNFREPPTGWYSLGKYDFSGDGTEYVKIIKETTKDDGPMRATCLRFAISDPEMEEDNYVSAFFGTDLHIVERLGMLIGEGDGITEDYIKKVPTRVQAAIMILRLNGLDAEAAAFTGADNFADASLEAWAMPYLAYLKAHPELGLIGTGDNMFEPTANIDAQAYAKILLTALGYEYNVDFTWDQTLAFAAEKGIAKAESTEFTVKDLAIMTASALNLNHKNGKKFLNKLIEERDGVADEGVYGIELPAELQAARDELRAKKRFIYNNDGNDVYKGYDYYPLPFDASGYDGNTINTDNFLKARSYGLEDTQVTTVTYCTGVFTSGHQESVGFTDLRRRDWAYRLKEFTGKDSLTTMVDYVHSIGREVFWSMRMNDTHDFEYQENELDPWKQANLDKLMFRRKDSATKMIHGDNRWSAADYTHKEVRRYVYEAFKDILTRYDVDGVELDFTRHPLYFKEVTQGIDIYPENIEKMNNFIRSLRDLTEQKSIEKGKPLLISIIVPDSLDFCYDIGLDVRTWCEEGLIDIVSVGSSHPGIFQTWEDAIAEYKDYDVLVHANLDGNTYQSNSSMDKYAIDKQEAALAYAAGADGITLFNYFSPNHERFDILGSVETCPPADPNYTSQRRLASLNTIKNQSSYITVGK